MKLYVVVKAADRDTTYSDLHRKAPPERKDPVPPFSGSLRINKQNLLDEVDKTKDNLQAEKMYYSNKIA
ncbi:hypothetical protein [Pantoea vagans]|uniref:hypothetical protein n=1 Tax=Pantoea vagans TaxID=470934 RepID=UPI0023AF8110|nr:hypothetical protein [Pantoea vagans]MDE8559262.1 hypothetical protein [Pantoea vagans]MDE8579262.1 hypothetical protein [Pantoea vagans]